MDTRLRRDVAWNLVPVALLGGVGLGMNFLMAKWWGAAALGVFNLVSIAYFVFAVIGACGLQFAVLRAVAEKPDDRERVAAVVVGALVPTLVLAAIATGLFLLARGPVERMHGSHEVATGMLWAAPGLFCFAINKVLFGVVNGLRRMRAFAVYTSLRYILLATALGIAHGVDLRTDHLAGIWSFTEGVLLLVLLGELIATVALTKAAGWRRYASEHLHYGARGVASTLAQEINSKLDVWMLGAAGVSKELVGVYSLAAALNEGAAQLGTVVQNNLNPLVAKSLAEGNPAEVELLVKRTRRWFVPVIAAGGTLAALAFPHVVPALVGDSTFAAGTWPFAVLMTALVLSSPYQPFTQILLMANKPSLHTLMLALLVAINLVANLLLIPRYGVLGAALATSITGLATALLVRRFARSRVGVMI
ncbi:MAG TPA: polysaccharide biosynthesis C-terminal domain-containing protein [Kofleriaceae bacterium]|nr:polysaccharide biosynthesis C-terminal domain-containing protein [Kofleriaceae bacterium]